MQKENQNSSSFFLRKVDKKQIPVCKILGVNIAAINMTWLTNYIEKNINALSGDYITVANVHTTVTAFENPDYLKIQNGGAMAIPDGGPLSSLGRKKGYKKMERTTGPSLMEEIFKVSVEKGYRHFFYGSTKSTLEKLEKNLLIKYPGLKITGLYSPPFTEMNDSDNNRTIDMINETKSDFVWVGLGAPKQEIWMARNQGRIQGLMIGVGAGFDFLAGNIKRAPKWMQKLNLEWLFRLVQNPKLFHRYFHTNNKFIWEAVIKRK